jgi:hypothetical protein
MFTPIPVVPPTIDLDPRRQVATLRDGAGKLELRLSYAKGCYVDRMRVLGKDVAGAEGLWSGIQVGGRWHTTAELAKPPKVAKEGDRLRVTGIEYGADGLRLVEAWTFTVKRDSVTWRIDRRYLAGGDLEGTAMPSMAFPSMNTWTGALLGTGGVAWCRLFDRPNATYGVHTDSATLWNPATDACLTVSAAPGGKGARALRFTREPSGGFSMALAATPEALRPKHGLSRFQRTRQDVWQGFSVRSGQVVSVACELKADGYRSSFGRGDFKALDTAAITELSNTIGRIGVIDDDLVGSNGWYSGYICMHEPWLARVGTALNDPNYTQSCARFLDYAREKAIMPDGMVKSRWKYDAGDAQPGTYDPANGFYEAQWGRLMDSQSSYVTNVADQFDASGDEAWVRRQKAACEAALEYLLRRDSDGDGLVEMANSLTSQRRSSDWLDIVWAAHENAFVNAQLYGALRKWSAVEASLGDGARARRYEDFAAKLKASFNKPISEGGFWDAAKGCYAYWRDADGTVHGGNLVIPINLTALAEGICDDPQRRRDLLATIEQRMEAESLLSWPACFESYAPGEGADDVFPTYENGDVFLAWAEYGIRAYAPTRPDLALKYLRRIVEQYKKDGLAFQRYLRKSGQGAGDDILANNCNALTGLYRDIYGIQPKPNRLYLEPHLVPELDGTRVEYDLRGRRLKLTLSVDSYEVRSANLTVRSSHPFGVDFRSTGLAFFAKNEGLPSVEISGPRNGRFDVSFGDWTKGKRWKVSVEGRSTGLTHTFHGLRPGARYAVTSADGFSAEVTADKPSVKISCKPGRASKFELSLLGRKLPPR